MASVEGARRMKRVGKFLILGGLASAVLGAITLFLGYLQRAQPYHPPVILLGLGTIALLYLGILPMIAGLLCGSQDGFWKDFSPHKGQIDLGLIGCA